MPLILVCNKTYSVSIDFYLVSSKTFCLVFEAETAVTVEGLKYVIDSGLVKVNYFDVRSGVDTLVCRTISKAAAKQRAGRAGRTQVFKSLCIKSWVFRKVSYRL